MLTFIDWFAGIGGFRRGMELAGHKCIGFCEYDKFAVKSYVAMHDTDREWFANDVRAVRFNDIPKSDVWCFGFPCQDISVAGKQKGMREGTRSGLFYTITSLLRKIEIEDRPGTLFIENVKNLLSINGGWDFAKVIIELDEVGYDCEWQLLNSKNFGVPQNRERVFIIGRLRGRSRGEIFPIIERSTEININQINNSKNQVHRFYGPDGLSPTLNTCGGGSHEPKIAIPVLTPDRLEKRQNGRRFKEDGEEMFCLTAQDRHGVLLQKRNGTFGKLDEYPLSGVGPTLTATCYKGPDLIQQDGMRIRKLTPLECFRLQGWSDDYFYKAASVNSDSQLYKQAGNGVTVNVIQAIAERLEPKEGDA